MSVVRSISKISRRFCSQDEHKRIQVCILGADTPMGQSLSFLLKQNPTVSGLHVQGTSRVESMGMDLNQFDTRCRVKSYFDMDSVAKSVKCADIVVMMGLNTCPTKMTLAKLVMAEGVRVVKLAEACSRFAPKAIVIVAINPISVTLPIVAEVYRKSDWYHPSRLLGSSALAQIKANAIAGHYQNLDPQIVHVPIVGGPDLDCAIPLFSQTLPVGVPPKDSEKLYEEFKKENSEFAVSSAVGINRMITQMAMGINGDFEANVSAFVRTRMVDTCKHLVCTVKIGKSGVIHNYGVQKLNPFELQIMEEVCLELRKREQMATEFANRPDKCTLPPFMVKELEKEKSDKMGIIR